MDIIIFIIIIAVYVVPIIKKNEKEKNNDYYNKIVKEYGLTQTQINNLKKMTVQDRAKYILELKKHMTGISRPGTVDYNKNYTQSYKQNYTSKVDCIHTTDKHEAIINDFKNKVECIHHEDDGYAIKVGYRDSNENPIRNVIENKNTFDSEDNDEAIKYL